MKKLYVLLTVGVSLLSFEASHATTWDVGVKSFAFNNSPAVVSVGDTIHWFLMDGSTHTTTSTTIPAGAASWDQPMNSFNQSFYYPVTVAGSYTYICTIHSMMTATFVAQIATAIPTPVVANANLLVTTDANNINVVYTVSDKSDTRVALTDLSGRTFYATQPVAQTAGTYNTMIPSAVLPKGIYLVSVQLGEATLTRTVSVN